MVGTIAIRCEGRKTDFTKGYKEEIVENLSCLYLEVGWNIGGGARIIMFHSDDNFLISFQEI